MNRYSFNDDNGSIKMCRVNEIPPVSMVFFCPDTLEATEAMGFPACPHCLPYNQKRT